MNNIITNGKYLLLVLTIMQTTVSSSTIVSNNVQSNHYFYDETIKKTEKDLDYDECVNNIENNISTQFDCNGNISTIKDKKLRFESINSISSITTNDSHQGLNENNNIQQDDNNELIADMSFGDYGEDTKDVSDIPNTLHEDTNIESDNKNKLNKNQATKQNDNYEIKIDGDINNMSFGADNNTDKFDTDYAKNSDTTNNNNPNITITINNKNTIQSQEFISNNTNQKIKVLNLGEIMALDNIADKLGSIFHAIQYNIKLQSKYKKHLHVSKVDLLKYEAKEIAQYFINNILFEKIYTSETSRYKKKYIKHPDALQYREELINCFANKGKLEILYGILKSWPVQDLLWEYKKNIINSDELFCQFQSKYFISHEAKILINRIIYLTTMYNSTFEQFYNSITFSNEIYRKLSIDQFVDLLKCSEFNDYLNNASIINSLLYFTTILRNTKVKNAIKNAIKKNCNR